MKICVVGSDQIYSIENFYIKYLKESGLEVEIFTAPVCFREYYKRSILNKTLYRLGVSPILKHINRKLLETMKGKKPDIVFVFKGMELFPETLRLIKNQGIILVNYNPDNPFIFSGKGSGNKNVSNSIPLYDLHFTYDTVVKSRMESEFKIPCEILPFGFDVPDDLYRQCMKENEIVRVCFLGNPDRQRAHFIQNLVDRGVEIDLYGHGWEKFMKASGVTIFDAVYGDEQWRVLRKYRVQLNLMRLHNPTSHNMRSFEVPAIGGIILEPDTPDHRVYFNDGDEVFLYSNADNCAAQIRLLLALPVERINKIRESARKRSVQSGYSYYDRTKYVVEVLNRFKR